MADWNGFRGAAKPLEDTDLPRIGERIGVGEDVVHGLLDVEASGKPFDKHGRPKMLFEPHVFYRNLKGDKRAEAVRQGLAYPKWKPGAYPKDSYDRLERAMKIDETAALKAASWGAGQILGENYRMAGYDSPQDMVRAFMDDADEHLEAMVSFCKAAGIDDELRRCEAKLRAGKKLTPADLAPIAFRYNGAKYATHNYHGRLADRMNWWAKKPDTPWKPGQEEQEEPHVAEPVPTPPPPPVAVPVPPAPIPAPAPPIVVPTPPPVAPVPPTPPTPVPPPPATADVPHLANGEVKAIQERLVDLGYFEVGVPDGKWGRRTIGAIAAFQAIEQLPVNAGLTPMLDPATRARLWSDQAKRAPISEERARVTADDLRRAGSSTVRRADKIAWAQYGQIGLAILEVIVYVANNYQATELPPWAAPVMAMAGVPQGLTIVLQIALAAWTKMKSSGVIMERVNSHRLGLHNGHPADTESARPVQAPVGLNRFNLTA
jgi:hypothetical protein